MDGPVALLWGCFFCLEVPEPVEGPLEAPLCGSTLLTNHGSTSRWKLRCEEPTVVRQAAGSSAAWFDKLTNRGSSLLTNRGSADY
ncbi:MAG: hypothetical protein II397_09095, partial [Treponema sp.]|nr:hypothetical protein [Treponema sp.]